MKSMMPLWLFLSGCAAQPHIHQVSYHYTDRKTYQGPSLDVWVWIDNSFDDVDRASITQAVMTWNRSLNGYITLLPVDKNICQDRPDMPRDIDWVVTKVDPGSNSLAKATEGQITLGTADFVGGHNIFLARDSMATEDVYYVSLHEIGHLLGAEHKGLRLMFPTYTQDGFHCIDYLTAWQVSGHYNIPVTNMNYCMRY